MSLKNNDGLCRTCARVSFRTLIGGSENQTNRELEFDEFWDLPKVLEERNCPFCRLLSWCFRMDGGFDLEDVGKFDRICGIYVGRELQVSLARKYGIKKSSYSIQICGSENSQVQKQLEQINPRTFDVGELKSWLNRCSERHEQCKAKVSFLRRPLPKGFRLIDVRRGCIVTAESDPTYCALSYVWGNANQLTLNKSNLAELEKEGALFSNELLLPKTITDAIKLCQDISQNYLWVDCLCILQDGEEDKHDQISSMDAVYNLSFLTIVAAAGDNANAGLSPYKCLRLNPSVSFHVETISGNNFITSLSPKIAAEVITISKWATRGWTLQEYVLSKRAVVFTGQYVFFRCEEGLWAEDFGLHLSSFSDSWPGWDLPLYRFSQAPHSVSRHYTGNYPLLVAQYVRRDLTKEGDVLNAFLGILSRLEDVIGTHFCGLPSKQFGSALLWSTDMSFPIKRISSFPSWSWAGWIHTSTVPRQPANYERPIQDDMYMHQEYDSWHTRSLLTCYKIEDDGKIQCFEKIDVDPTISVCNRAIQEDKIPSSSVLSINRTINKHLTPPYNHQDLLNLYVSARERSRPPASHYVFFWTSCGTLYVDRQPKNDRGDDLRIKKFAVRTERNTSFSAGYVRLDCEWREKQPDLLEFAVTTFGLALTYLSHHIDLGLILITRRCDSMPKAYTRVAVLEARMKQETWIDFARPEQRLVALI